MSRSTSDVVLIRECSGRGSRSCRYGIMKVLYISIRKHSAGKIYIFPLGIYLRRIIEHSYGIALGPADGVLGRYGRTGIGRRGLHREINFMRRIGRADICGLLLRASGYDGRSGRQSKITCSLHIFTSHALKSSSVFPFVNGAAREGKSALHGEQLDMEFGGFVIAGCLHPFHKQQFLC